MTIFICNNFVFNHFLIWLTKIFKIANFIIFCCLLDKYRLFFPYICLWSYYSLYCIVFFKKLTLGAQISLVPPRQGGFLDKLLHGWIDSGWQFHFNLELCLRMCLRISISKAIRAKNEQRMISDYYMKSQTWYQTETIQPLTYPHADWIK